MSACDLSLGLARFRWVPAFCLLQPPALTREWLISLPLKLIGISIGAVLALVKTILFLPARMLGHSG
jgi:hypothetical protein